MGSAAPTRSSVTPDRTHWETRFPRSTNERCADHHRCHVMRHPFAPTAPTRSRGSKTLAPQALFAFHAPFRIVSTGPAEPLRTTLLAPSCNTKVFQPSTCLLNVIPAKGRWDVEVVASIQDLA